jgi:1-acyl-sn-glycerol-3-phosphate acyltransferase
MLFIRSLIFNIYTQLWTFSLAAFSLPFLLTPPKTAVKIGYAWATGIMFGLRYICGIKYEIRGFENLPPEPFIIASKHQSAWETAIFLKLLDAPTYILKKELLKIPLFGLHLKAMEMIAVDRQGGSNALKKLQADVKDRLSKKRSIVIFPEGTRTKPSEKIDYQPGVAFIYMDIDGAIPVIPVALNSGIYWGKNSFLKRPGTITMEYLKPIPHGLGRKEFMIQLQNAIEEKSAQLCERKVNLES